MSSRRLSFPRLTGNLLQENRGQKNRGQRRKQSRNGDHMVIFSVNKKLTHRHTTPYQYIRASADTINCCA